MAILIDTSVLIDAERRALPIDRRFDADTAGISVVTASELLHAVHRARDPQVRARRAAFVEGLLAALEPLPVTVPIARAHARIWAELERDGKMIGAHDMWIAATAVSHGMEVATSNTAEFERVPGLAVVPA
ncbi:MAG: PIN domain-containing protein [Actinobacteria bacterium]|nr:PIN domain-containing protein [Actinomycetota bacterium]